MRSWKDIVARWSKHPNVRQFQDTRNLVLAGFAVLAVLVTWSGVKAVQANYDLQKQISRLEQENEIKKLENQNLELGNQYYETDQYLELSARQQFGLAAPGEKVILVPKSVALKYTTPAESSQSDTVPTSTKSTIQKNFESWMNFFLNRPQPIDE